ncbi:MAG: hypothetical protein ACI9G5_001783 [Paracoccaceae bacterium]|jgi:hypothetical protein
MSFDEQQLSPYANASYVIEDRTLSYPTRFHDGSVAMAMFAVSASVADELIKNTPFRVARIAPRTALLSLICVNYTDTQVGEYQELALAFFVEPFEKKRRLPYLSTLTDILSGKVASYTWYLPVTTTLSQECGKQMWGFPKTVEDIRFERKGERAEFSLHRAGESVLRFAVKAKGSMAPKSVSSPVYSLFQDRPHVGYLAQQFRGVGYQLGGAELELGDSDITEPLKALGLPKRSLLSGWMEHLTFSMSAPYPLAPENPQ